MRFIACLFLSNSCVYTTFKMNFFKIPSKIDALKIYMYIFLRHIIMANNVHLTYYQRNKELILSKAKEYYKNNQEKLSKQVTEKYNNLPVGKKEKKREYRRKMYHTVSEEEQNKRRE